MFTNLCLILLLLLAGSLQFRNYTFNDRKKAKKKSRQGSNIVQLADGVTAVAQLYTLYSHRARSFNQWQRALYPNFIINKDKKCSILSLSWVYLDKDRILAAFKFSCLFISSLRSSVSVWSWSDFWRSSASLFWRVLKPWISEIVLQRQGQLPLLKFSHRHALHRITGKILWRLY